MRALILAIACLAGLAGPAGALDAYDIVGDAIPASLAGLTGDVARGESVVRDRERGNCLICHQGADASEPFQGTIGPALSGVGERLQPGQIRLRMVD
ncbi:MAG: sulfur oxidation c-type cytochrome SoxX, partial [Bosea sp. (in: a-proteobacteria)]